MEIIANKVARFLELSGQFSKSLHDIFPQESNLTFNSGTFATNSYGLRFDGNIVNQHAIAVSGTFILNGREIYIDNNGDVKSRDNKPLTRADEIRAKAEIQAKLSDDLDEYNNLCSSLLTHF